MKAMATLNALWNVNRVSLYLCQVKGVNFTFVKCERRRSTSLFLSFAILSHIYHSACYNCTYLVHTYNILYTCISKVNYGLLLIVDSPQI